MNVTYKNHSSNRQLSILLVLLRRVINFTHGNHVTLLHASLGVILVGVHKFEQIRVLLLS